MFKQYKLKNYRFRLVAYVVILCIIGVMVVGSAKPSVQNKQIGRSDRRTYRDGDHIAD